MILKPLGLDFGSKFPNNLAAKGLGGYREAQTINTLFILLVRDSSFHTDADWESRWCEQLASRGQSFLQATPKFAMSHLFEGVSLS